MGARIGWRALLDCVLDADSWQPWDIPLPTLTITDDGYLDDLTRARQRTQLDETVIAGEGRIDGRRVALLVQDFDFLGGSLGVAATERLVCAMERATTEGLPLLASPTSGGTRMQEGTVAFVQMVKIAQAVSAHKNAGLPYLVYLRNPTTGGVLASLGSLGHVTVAEPDALIGFLGPRVYEALTGDNFPAGVQVAENLFEHGIVDAVLPVEGLRPIVSRALRVLLPDDAPFESAAAPSMLITDVESTPDIPAWDSILRTRRPERPGVRALLRNGATDVLPLHGTGAGETDPELLLALARFGSARCIVIGQDRRGHAVQPLGPAGLRAARRGMYMAAELGLPLVSVIDTAGAALSQQAEEAALAGEIARSLAQLVGLRVPTLSLILGMGTGGGALALLPADRVLAAQHGWLSPLPPEGASAILHRTVDRAPDMAKSQGVRSRDLLAAHIIDAVVPELPDASDEAAAFCQRAGSCIESQLIALSSEPQQVRLRRRAQRIRNLGL